MFIPKVLIQTSLPQVNRGNKVVFELNLFYIIIVRNTSFSVKKACLSEKKEHGGYDPAKSNYHPIEDAVWTLNEK